MTVKCALSTFLLFTELELMIEAVSGSKPHKIRKTAHPEELRNNFKLERTWYFDVPENFATVICTAPYRHSSKWLSVSLNVSDILNSDSASFPTYWIIIII